MINDPEVELRLGVSLGGRLTIHVANLSHLLLQLIWQIRPASRKPLRLPKDPSEFVPPFVEKLKGTGW